MSGGGVLVRAKPDGIEVRMSRISMSRGKGVALTTANRETASSETDNMALDNLNEGKQLRSGWWLYTCRCIALSFSIIDADIPPRVSSTLKSQPFMLGVRVDLRTLCFDAHESDYPYKVHKVCCSAWTAVKLLYEHSRKLETPGFDS